MCVKLTWTLTARKQLNDWLTEVWGATHFHNVGKGLGLVPPAVRETVEIRTDRSFGLHRFFQSHPWTSWSTSFSAVAELRSNGRKKVRKKVLKVAHLMISSRYSARSISPCSNPLLVFQYSDLHMNDYNYSWYIQYVENRNVWKSICNKNQSY